MKFHHLARHQFVGAHQPAQRADSPPQSNKRQASELTSEDEDEDFLDQHQRDSIFEHAEQVANQPILAQQHQQQLSAGQQHQQHLVESSGFLMDKNKKLFPQKLWELIHNPSIQHCLRWSDDGQRVYLNRNEFEAYYLKTANNQFHTQKAISFVRQMNMYGFRKVDDCYYENDNFRRDRQHLLRNMIRRHPNKGLFVGLDHHQLAAAAAAQQALQVNQQLQQLEQQHKQRTEQALRLNGYLNNHQFHQVLANSAHLASQNSSLKNQHHHSSAPFESMSSQLARAAVNHLTQQQQSQHQHQQHNHNQRHHQQHSANLASVAGELLAAQAHLSARPVQPAPKKSRLLGNFYASSTSATIAATNHNHNTSTNNNINTNNMSSNGVSSCANLNSKTSATNKNHLGNQQLHNQDSMHSNSSVDTQPSQCSSTLNSGSAGSPQPVSPSALNQRLSPGHTGGQSSLCASVFAGTNHHHHHNHHQSHQSIQSAADKFAQNLVNVGQVNSMLSQHMGAADLSTNNQSSIASRQAQLQQSLVRSLLQLKQHQQHPQDLLGSLQLQQHHHHRSLLESLASLSSAGTGSIVDPTSNSPTERTLTPPSGPPSPSARYGSTVGAIMLPLDDTNCDIALDLAKSSSQVKIELPVAPSKGDDHDFAGQRVSIKSEQQLDSSDKTITNEIDVAAPANSPIDGAKKVRRFLESQMSLKSRMEGANGARVCNHFNSDDVDADDDTDTDAEHDNNCHFSQRKRAKLSQQLDNCPPPGDLLKAAVFEVCQRKAYRLEMSALHDAIGYTERFVELLLDKAALIASQQTCSDSVEEEGAKDMEDEDKQRLGTNQVCLLDSACVSSALNLLVSDKLLLGKQVEEEPDDLVESLDKSTRDPTSTLINGLDLCEQPEARQADLADLEQGDIKDRLSSSGSSTGAISDQDEELDADVG